MVCFLLLDGISIFVGYLMPKLSFKKISSDTISHIAEEIEAGSYLFQGCKSKSERNSPTGVRISLIRGRSPAL